MKDNSRVKKLLDICYFLMVSFGIGLVVECSPMDRQSGIQSQVELYQRLKKWCLLPLYLTLSIIRFQG